MSGWFVRVCTPLVALVASVPLLSSSSCSEAPQAAETQAAPASLAHRKTVVGVNLSGLQWYGNQRAFANLMAVSAWSDGWKGRSPDLTDERGTVKSLRPGQFAPAMLGLPAGPFKSVRVRCTYKGKGAVRSDGFVRYVGAGRGYYDFDFVWPAKLGSNGYIQIEKTDPTDPIRDFDCREPDMPADAVYAPAFITSLRGFKVIRFLDWQETNGNQGGKWSRFAPIGGQFRRGGPEGVRVEDMVLLANQSHSNPWFLMPYNADEEYISSFAKYVHDHLDPGLVAHVELSNEVWNYVFPATQQAWKEGVAAGLSTNEHQALLRRYAQKSVEALKIWTRIFSDNPKRLVRIVSTQNDNPASAEWVLGFGETAKFVDALATAPYFFVSLKGRSIADVDKTFAELPSAIDRSIGLAVKNKAVAARYGKRFIAYEAGQHLVTEDQAFAEALQRDPRMGQMYALYLDQWDKNIGDLIVLYSHTSSISKFGSWGLREYADQPASEAPKWAAVQRFLTGHGLTSQP